MLHVKNIVITYMMRILPVSLFVLVVLFSVGLVSADTPDTDPVNALRIKYSLIRNQLNQNSYNAPLYLESTETENRLQGDVYGVIDHPFAKLEPALTSANHWCGIMHLHLNVKYCRGSKTRLGDLLTVYIGRKYFQQLDDAHRIDYGLRVSFATMEYLKAHLTADRGPFGTHDYLIMMEALPLQPGKSFVHLRYSYNYGMVARLSMQAYLETLGRNKVGFTRLGSDSAGEPVFVTGVRGAVERNSMRYFMAIQAYLVAQDEAPQIQLEKRLHEWFALTERYSRQLHEIDKDEYLKMKRAEYIRQNKGG